MTELGPTVGLVLALERTNDLLLNNSQQILDLQLQVKTLTDIVQRQQKDIRELRDGKADA